jgi:hypothetical protein
MAQIVFRGFSDDMIAGNAIAAADLRVLLVMTNTTVDTEHDVQTLSGFTTLDECDGVGYARLDLASVAGAWDATNNRYEWDADDGDMDGGTNSILASTRDIQGFVIYRHVDGTDANDVPWVYSDTGGFPFTTGGGSFDFTWDTEGLIQVKSA